MRNYIRNYCIAFTLIELLVVISIISILMTILLPSLRKARDNSKGIVCRGNLKQCGQATFMYTNDNNGYLPPFAWGDWWLKGEEMIWYDEIEPYMNHSVYHCPSDKDPYDFDVNGYGPAFRAKHFDGKWLLSYRYSSRLGWNDVVRTGRPAFRITQCPKSPALYVVLHDGTNTNSIYMGDDGHAKFGGLSPTNSLPFRHGGTRDNHLYVDGHVKMMRERESYNNGKCLAGYGW